MRPPADYLALHDIKIPDSYAYRYRAGDELTELARVHLGLVVGVDVEPLRTDAMARPADDADRATWQDYAVVRGVPYTEAVNLDRKELMARLETAEDPADPANAGAQPAEADRKQRWVDYAVLEIIRATGGQVSQEQAADRLAEMTKADLIAVFGPEPDEARRAELTAVPEADPSGQVRPDQTER